MFKFKVKNKSYSLPQTLYEVAYNQGIEIEALKTTFGGVNYGYKLNVLQMLSGCNELSEVVEDEINIIYDSLPLFNSPEIGLNPVVLMNNKIYGLVDLDNITLSEYMDIERLLDSAKDDYYSIISSLAALLYRPIKSTKHSFTSRLLNFKIRFKKHKFIKPFACLDYETKDFNLNTAEKLVSEIENSFSWSYLLGGLSYYIKWKQDLAKKYFLVFPVSDNPCPKTETEAINMSTIWGMYHQIGLMTDSNLKDMNYYKSSKLSAVMYHLSYCIQNNNYKNTTE